MPVNDETDNRSSYEEQVPISENLVVADQAELSSNSHSVDQTTLTPVIQQSTLQCMFRYGRSFTSLCDTCIKKASKKSNLQRHWLRAERASAFIRLRSTIPKELRRIAKGREYARVESRQYTHNSFATD